MVYGGGGGGGGGAKGMLLPHPTPAPSQIIGGASPLLFLRLSYKENFYYASKKGTRIKYICVCGLILFHSLALEQGLSYFDNFKQVLKIHWASYYRILYTVGTKICSSCPGHMTNVAATSI